MNSVAFIFKTPPHGSSTGREGLDALLATAALSEDIGVFFMGDGVFHLITSQQPEAIYARDYITTFKLLDLYDVEDIFVCQQSLEARGLTTQNIRNLDAEVLSIEDMQQRLNTFDKVLSF